MGKNFFVLTHHLGRRAWNYAELFRSKLERATENTFQLTTDGFEGYEPAVRLHLWGRVDYAMLIKEFGADPEGERRPARCTSTATLTRIGSARPISSGRI